MGKNVIDKISDYYTEKIKKFRACAKGADWNGEASQLIRFEQQVKLIKNSEDFFSINYYGCGAFAHFLSEKFSAFEYEGIDVSDAMIQESKKFCSQLENCQLLVGKNPSKKRIMQQQAVFLV